MMSDAALALFHSLVASEAFNDAMTQFVQTEVEIRVPLMRSAIRAGDSGLAMGIEGEITLLEDLRGLFKKHAQRYSRPIAV